MLACLSLDRLLSRIELHQHYRIYISIKKPTQAIDFNIESLIFFKVASTAIIFIFDIIFGFVEDEICGE